MNFTYDQYAEQLRKDAALPERAVEVIRRTVKLVGPRAVQAEIEAVAGRRPVDRGTYRRSFRFEDIPRGAIAYNFAPHAPIIEGGRRRGAKPPPTALIEAWVRRKGIGVQYGPIQRTAQGRDHRGRFGSRVRRKLSEKQVRGIAYVIARAIGRRGLPAHMVVARASEVIDEKVAEALTREIG